MPQGLISLARFREQAHAGGNPPKGGVYRLSLGAPKIVDEARRAIRFCFSDSSVDREGDSIDASGWVTDAFMKNPVALWAHDSASPPIGRAANLAVEMGRLMGDIEFAPPEIYPFADTIYRMVGAGYINAVSVGFMPIEYSFVENDPSRGWGIDFKRQELLEISACPVPANANALVEARAKGIDVGPLVDWAERTLQGGGRVMVPRGELERLRSAAKGSSTMRKPAKAVRREDPPEDDPQSDGLSTDDPAAGGAVVATCGRAVGQPCGMIDPEECSVHRTKADDESDEDKRLAALIARAVRAELRRLAPRRRAEGDPEPAEEPTEEPDHRVELRAAHLHLKMAKDARDIGDGHHDEAMKRLQRAIAALDDDGGDDDAGDAGDGDPDNPNPDDDPGVTRVSALAEIRHLRTAGAV